MLVSFVRPSFINILETHLLALLFKCNKRRRFSSSFQVQTIFVLAVKIVQNQSDLRPRFPLRIELLCF